MVRVADLMARVKKDMGSHYYPFPDELHDDMVEKPHKYRVSKMGERSESRRIGIQFIPEKGRILNYINNFEIGWIDAPNYPKEEKQRLHLEFPELFNPGERAIIKRVEEVSIKRMGQVELRIGRYIIEKRPSTRRKATTYRAPKCR